MQRRDVLALHVASDPGLALDIMVFTLVDADTHDWRERAATTLREPVPAGPIIGFEAKDAPASSGLAELRSSIDESWRAGDEAISRIDMFGALPDDRSEEHKSELQSLMRISNAAACMIKQKIIK